ncbi:MAG: ABC transporter substrate-binding protein [Faecousia sp.]
MFLLLLLLGGCTVRETGEPEEVQAASGLSWDAMVFDHSMPLSFANQFTVDYYQEGYRVVIIGGSDKYLVIPEGGEIPSGVPDSVTVLKQPIQNIYLVATSAMDLFRKLDAMDAIRLSGTDASGWYLPEAKEAMEQGQILYAGKYSAPDYERIVSAGCGLALESTMIYHTPEVKEQLERFGIPVLVERSSYESHPLGRMEWIKLYGTLLGKEAAAEGFFAEQLKLLMPILDQENTGKTVAFFYITSNGAVNVRKSGDYIAKCIQLAGGVYLPENLTEENALSTMTVQMETFYQEAREADILIYNSTIDAELHSIDQLLEKSSFLKDFKAVQTGNVWCTGKNLFQESLGLGNLILDIHAILNAQDPSSLELTFLHKLS